MIASRLRRSAHSRNLGSLLFRGAYPIQVHGSHHVPLHEPLIVIVDSIDPVGQLLIKSVSPRPLIAFTQIIDTEFTGDIPFQEPFGISAQLDALAALQQGGAILLNMDRIEPGFLVNQSGAVVVAASLWVEHRGDAGFSPWGARPATPRSRVRLYFDQVSTPIVSEVSAPAAGGLVTIDRFVSERCRQILQDHKDLVRQRLGERTAR